jgi:hypothetical protein
VTSGEDFEAARADGGLGAILWRGVVLNTRDEILQRALDGMQVAKQGAARLADIADIPHDRRDAFCTDAKNIINFAHTRTIMRTQVKISRATERKFKKIEAAVVALRGALGSLTKEEKRCFETELWGVRRHLDPERWPFPGLNEKAAVNAFHASSKVSAYELRALAFASASLVNKDPNRRGKRGRRADPALLRLVSALWRCAREHGGELSANSKENKASGTMFKALEELRPYFAKMPYGAGLIPSGLPVRTIVDVVTKLKKGTQS